jgi:hypothetical protein
MSIVTLRSMKIDRSQSTHCGKIINEVRNNDTGILEVKQ